MARMNWGKATRKARIGQAGSEQITEFGDAIDRARHAAMLVNKQLASGSKRHLSNENAAAYGIGKAPHKSKLVKQEIEHKIRNHEQYRSNKHRFRSDKVNAEDENYLVSLRVISKNSGPLTTYEKAIDDFLKQDIPINNSNLPKHIRKIVDGIIAVRLASLANMQNSQK